MLLELISGAVLVIFGIPFLILRLIAKVAWLAIKFPLIAVMDAMIWTLDKLEAANDRVDSWGSR